jgi:sphinganine-1-phosphate aldolase
MPDACGLLTSGGTESILLAMLAHRETARTRGESRPQIIMSSTAHGAFVKAAFYFGIELVVAHPHPVTLRLGREGTFYP